MLQRLLPAVRVYYPGCLRDCLCWIDMDADSPERRSGQLEGEDSYKYAITKRAVVICVICLMSHCVIAEIKVPIY